MRNVLRYVLFLLGLFALAYFLLTLDWQTLQESMRRLDPLFLLGAALASLFNITLKAIRWRLLIQSATAVRISFTSAFASIYAGVASSSLVPGRAIEIAKPLILKGLYRVPLTPSTLAMLVERALDLFSVVAIFLLSLLFLPGAAGSMHLPAKIALVLVILLAATMTFPRIFWHGLQQASARLPWPEPFRKQIGEMLLESGRSFLIWGEPKHFGLLLVLSMVALTAEVVRFYCVFRSMGLVVIPLGLALGYTASILVGTLSLLPGGLGVTESFQGALLPLFIIGEGTPGVERGAVLLDRILSYYLVVLVGAIVLFWYQRALRHKMECEIHAEGI